MTETVLYRLYGARGNLLYVGITCGPRERFKAHLQEKDWWRFVVGSTFEHFDSREAALAAEAEAIQTEDPYYNRQGRTAEATKLVQHAQAVRSYVTCLLPDGADRYSDLADFLDAFGLYDAYDNSADAREVIDWMLVLLNRAFPTPGKPVCQ